MLTWLYNHIAIKYVIFNIESFTLQLEDGTIPEDPQEDGPLNDDRVNSVASSLFADEPLYQIYHAGAVARDVIGQTGDVDEEDGKI